VAVSRPIFAEDGIETYNDTSVEFGHFVTRLVNRLGTDSLCFWISFPERTMTSELASCLKAQEFGKPEVAFTGSPLTLVLLKMMGGLPLKEEMGQSLVRWWLARCRFHSCLVEVPLPTGDGAHTSTLIIQLEDQDFSDLVLPLLRDESYQQSSAQLEPRLEV